MKTSGHKQSVGIHTDITFELTENKTNAESTEDDNREVPVFLGTDVGNGGNQLGRRYDPNSNRPIFYGTNDDANGFAGGDAGTWQQFYPPANEWTTEKYSSGRKYKSKLMLAKRKCIQIISPIYYFLDNVGNTGFIPYGIGQKTFAPCICPNGQSSWRRIDIYPSNAQKQTAVDGKLELPFE